MKITLALLFGLFMFAGIADTEKLLTGKEIYGVNCDAVVQILADGTFSNGFIVSADGIIMTANHVVATKESGSRRYAKDIKVSVYGHATPFNATPLIAQISDDQVNYDSALIKISVASQLPHVTLGNWKEVDIGDRVTLLPSLPGIGCAALEGVVAKAAAVQTPLGHKPVSTIFFQSSVRNDFSGSPIFSAKGNVIAIVDTKAFGISIALNNLRNRWTGTQSGIRTTSRGGGLDIGSSFLELINNLDQNLISGLGSGVAIDHAKDLQATIK